MKSLQNAYIFIWDLTTICTHYKTFFCFSGTEETILTVGLTKHPGWESLGWINKLKKHFHYLTVSYYLCDGLLRCGLTQPQRSPLRIWMLKMKTRPLNSWSTSLPNPATVTWLSRVPPTDQLWTSLKLTLLRGSCFFCIVVRCSKLFSHNIKNKTCFVNVYVMTTWTSRWQCFVLNHNTSSRSLFLFRRYSNIHDTVVLCLYEW